MIREDKKPRSAENASGDTFGCNIDSGESRGRSKDQLQGGGVQGSVTRSKGQLESEKVGLGSLTLEFSPTIIYWKNQEPLRFLEAESEF